MSDGPFNLEDFLASTVEALKVRGDARAIALILSGECDFEFLNSDWGVDYWRLNIGIPTPLFHVLTKDEVSSVEKSVHEVGQQFFRSRPADSLSSAQVHPTVVQAPEGWREQALKYVRGEGVTNQGRVRSDNIASKEHRGLLFRSKAEINLFEAMQRAQLAVAPLPVFVRVGKSYHRLEPDFIVVFKGLTFVVEVDGDTFHRESPADADKRLVPLTYEGVEVRRIRAEDVTTDELADAAVKDLVQFMGKRKAAR
jgi:very-short-patch-repair endonuclease